VRTVCGRLKSDYSYASNVVYNTFPWPLPTDDQKQKIEQTAQGILNARALYPDSCKRQVLFPKKRHLFFPKCGKLFSRVCGILFSRIYVVLY
jgi:hypothetical protein